MAGQKVIFNGMHAPKVVPLVPLRDQARLLTTLVIAAISCRRGIPVAVQKSDNLKSSIGSAIRLDSSPERLPLSCTWLQRREHYYARSSRLSQTTRPVSHGRVGTESRTSGPSDCAYARHDRARAPGSPLDGECQLPGRSGNGSGLSGRNTELEIRTDCPVSNYVAHLIPEGPFHARGVSASKQDIH